MIILRPGLVKKLSLKPDRVGEYVGCLGHRRYHFNNIPPEIIEHQAIPLFFSFDKILTAVEAGAMGKLLGAISVKRWGFTWESFTTIRYDDCTLIYPIVDGDNVYASDLERITIFTIDTSKLIDRRLIHSDLAAVNYSNKFPGVDVTYGVVTYDAVLYYFITNRELQHRMLEVEYDVGKLTDAGVFTDIDRSDIRQFIKAEICLVWNLKRTVDKGIVFYSQNPQNVLTRVEEKKPQNLPKLAPRPVIRRKPQPQSVRAHARYDNIQFVKSGQPLPYLLSDIEYHDWMEKSVDQILIDRVPIVRLQGSYDLSREDLLNETIRRYRIVTRGNKWLTPFTPSVTEDNQVLVPVLGPDDLKTFLSETRDQDVPNVVPGTVKDGYVILPEKIGYKVDISQREWSEGTTISPWSAYLLVTKGFSSCMI